MFIRSDGDDFKILEEKTYDAYIKKFGYNSDFDFGSEFYSFCKQFGHVFPSNPDDFIKEFLMQFDDVPEDVPTVPTDNSNVPINVPIDVPTNNADSSDFVPTVPTKNKKKSKVIFDDHSPSRSTKSVIPDCPVDLNIPFNFGFDKNGITRSSPTYGSVTVSHTPVVITRRFIEPNSYKHKYEIAFTNYKGDWIKKIVDKSVLADHKKIIQLADFGIDFTSSEAKYLAKFLNDFIHAGNNAVKISTTDAFNQPGWNDDFSKFIYPTGDKDYICKRDGFDYDKLFASKGNTQKWKDMFNQVCDNGGSVAKIIIGAAMAASLVKPLNLPNIQAHIHGVRGIGKTALPKFAASAFGDPRPGRLSRTFAGTMKNKLETAAAFRDLPVILDELETISTKADEDKLSAMIYDYSLGIANQANKRDGTARDPVEFSGSRISTGERPLVKSNDKAGAFKRVLNIRAKSLFDDSFASILHRFSENNFGLFGKSWTEYIISHIDDIRKDFDFYFDFSKQRGFFHNGDFKKIQVEPTQLKAVIACAVSFKHFSLSIGLDFDEEILPELISDIVLDLPTTKEIDDTNRAKDALASFVAGHKKFFVSENKFSSDNPELDAVAFEIFGKIFDNGEVAFLPHKLKQILEQELGFASSEKLIAEWADEGKLRCQNGFTYKTRINNKPIWTYRFQPNVLISSDDSE